MVSITMSIRALLNSGETLPATPVISHPGAIAGTPEIYHTLTHSGAAHTGDTLSLQWFRDGVEIASATGASLLLIPEHDGAEITVGLVSTNSSGTATAMTSGVTAAYKAPASEGSPVPAALAVGAMASLDFTRNVTGEGGSWSVASGEVPAGMTHSEGIVFGIPVRAQPAATLVLRYKNSGGHTDVSRSVSVKTASIATPPIAEWALGPRYVQENTGTIYASYEKSITGNNLTYSLDNPPAGVTINASGVLALDTNVLSRMVDRPVTIRATNTGGSTTASFLLTCGPQLGVVAPENIMSISGNRSKIINAALAVNAKHIRYDFNTEYVFPTPTGKNWENPDDYYARAIDAGLTPLFVFAVLPKWARNGGRNWQSYPDATNRALIANALKVAAARYPLANWEFLNEQNHTDFAPQLDPEGYMTYAKACAAAIRAGNPSAVVVAQGLTNAPVENPGSHMAAETFLRRTYAAGAASVFDAVASHPYVWPFAPTGTDTWNGWWIAVNRLRPLMSANGHTNAKMWMTEYGGPTGGSGSVWTQQNQADCILSAWKLAAATSWVGPLFIYATIDRGGDSSTDTEDHYGLYEQDGTTPKAAVAVMAQIQKGA